MNLGERFNVEKIPLETALNFISDGLMIVNSKLEILMFNDAAKVICGVLPEGHYTNWPSFVGVYQKDKKTMYDSENLPLVRAIRGEIVSEQHLYLKNEILDAWKTVSCSASPIKDNDVIVGAILTFRDITDTLKKEEQTRKERSFYHKILNSLPAYVFSKDLDGNYTFLNSKFKNDFQKSFGMAPTKETLVGELAWKVSARDQQVIASKIPQEFEEEYPHAISGQRLHFRTTRIPLMDQDEEVYGVCGIAYDITTEVERKKILEEERNKIATASKLAALGMLAAEIGHEINNPLAIIRTCSWIMRKVFNEEVFQRDFALSKLDEIDNTIQRISEIVTSVKNLSRDSSTETMKKYFLKDILRDVQSICGPKFHTKGIQFILDQQNVLMKEEVECFRVQLSEVFINLIVNAVDAIEESDSPFVKLEILAEPNTLVFRVTDSGPGVSEDIEKKIFAPFFSTKEIGKGTGLGLSISKEIMKRHGGDLILNRRISANCFEVHLPHSATT